MHRLPDFVDVETGQKAEAQLARLGTEHRPDELSKLADKLTDCLNPDGNFTNDDRARRRGITIGKQDIDGMSPISGYLTPEARATLDAVFAKLAAPGMCNPGDDTPCVQGSPSEQAVGNDTRSCAQRNHDALNAAGRALLASGDLGQHNGLPASIIVTTTRQFELEAARVTPCCCWHADADGRRGGLARHAHHYLAIFDNGRALALYHTKRLASPAQRIVLYANDRGCTAPGCDVPGYLTEVHHVTAWAKTHTTAIDNFGLGLADLITNSPCKATRASRQGADSMDPAAAPGPHGQRAKHVPSPRKAAVRRRSVTGRLLSAACRIALFPGELWRSLGEGCRDTLRQVLGRQEGRVPRCHVAQVLCRRRLKCVAGRARP